MNFSPFSTNLVVFAVFTMVLIFDIFMSQITTEQTIRLFWKNQKDSRGQTLICLKSLAELTKDEITRSKLRFLTTTVLARICFLQSDSLPKRRNIGSNHNHRRFRCPNILNWCMDGYSWRLDMFNKPLQGMAPTPSAQNQCPLNACSL